MKRLYTILIILLAGLSVVAQDITVVAKPDTSSVLIGDQIYLTVKAEMPSGTKVTLMEASDSIAGKILILGKPTRDTVIDNGSMVVSDRYLITSFDSGAYVIPPFYAEVESGDSLRRYYSDYSLLNVNNPLVTPADTTDVIFDIVGPRKAPVKFDEILPWIIIVLISAAVLYLLARFLPRNPLKRFIKPVPPREPAHVIALRALKLLHEKELWQKGEIKAYYSELSDIMRRYIFDRYGIFSPEMTSDETVRMLQKSASITHDQLLIVKELLSVSDMVKFAKYKPAEEIYEKSFSDTNDFVEMTRVTEIPEPDQTASKGGDHA